MAESHCSLSIHEDLDKFDERKEKRRSVFENSDTSTNKESLRKQEKWKELWGEYNLDYVNVLQCSDDYVQKIKEEKELLLKGIKACKKTRKFGRPDEKLVLSEDVLTTEQKNSLRSIDSKINNYIEKSVKFLRNFEVYKRMEELKLEKIEEERKAIERSIKKNDFKS